MAIEGIDTFQGDVFHSARWNHDLDLVGTRVAVIGTGASAIQIVPELAGRVAHLDVYQRTAPWVMPRHDRPYTPIERFGFLFAWHDPARRAMCRAVLNLGASLGLPIVVEGVTTPAVLALLRDMGHRYLQGYVFSRPLEAEQLTAGAWRAELPAPVPAVTS